MEFSKTVKARHSSRDFRSDPLARDMLERIVETARRAPSSANLQPWRFWVVTGDTRMRLGEVIAQSTVHLEEYMEVLGPERYEAAVTWYSSLGNAPVLIVVSARCAPVEFEALNRNLSIGAAMENLLLAVADEGIGACNITFSHWVKGELAAVLGLSDSEEVVNIVALGVPSDTALATPPLKPDDTVWLD